MVEAVREIHATCVRSGPGYARDNPFGKRKKRPLRGTNSTSSPAREMMASTRVPLEIASPMKEVGKGSLIRNPGPRATQNAIHRDTVLGTKFMRHPDLEGYPPIAGLSRTGVPRTYPGLEHQRRGVVRGMQHAQKRVFAAECHANIVNAAPKMQSSNSDSIIGMNMHAPQPMGSDMAAAMRRHYKASTPPSPTVNTVYSSRNSRHDTPMAMPPDGPQTPLTRGASRASAIMEAYSAIGPYRESLPGSTMEYTENLRLAKQAPSVPFQIGLLPPPERAVTAMAQVPVRVEIASRVGGRRGLATPQPISLAAPHFPSPRGSKHRLGSPSNERLSLARSHALRGFAPDWYLPVAKARPPTPPQEPEITPTLAPAIHPGIVENEPLNVGENETMITQESSGLDVVYEGNVSVVDEVISEYTDEESMKEAMRKSLQEEDRRKKAAEIEAMRTDWQPMGTTCKVKAKNLGRSTMLYSGESLFPFPLLFLYKFATDFFHS